ncbi:MAG: LysM peptidoglycan-binding domain-containing protein, partial [Bacteroidales bacterium]|nr:LysM peptidoglycan-binding domain-containing protein [Bacteroidales bacterium]
RFKGEPFNPRLLIDFENCRLAVATLTLSENSYKLFGKTMTASAQPAKTAPPTAQKTTPAKTGAASSVHIVQKGDTLYSLARRHGITVEALRKLNKLTEKSVIKIGQQLIVPN